MPLSRSCRLYLGLVAFSLAGSLLSRVARLDPGPIAPVAALLTLGTGLWAALGPTIRRVPLAVLLVLVVGAGAEIAGIYTGLPFGRYAYTDRWWPTVLLPGEQRFPVQLPFAWLLMAGAAYLALASRWTGLRAVAAAALLASGIDFVMEPVMAGSLGYWRWNPAGPLPGGAPWLNPLGWFATSLAAGAILQASGEPHRKRPEPAAVLMGHVVLVLGLGVIALL